MPAPQKTKRSLPWNTSAKPAKNKQLHKLMNSGKAVEHKVLMEALQDYQPDHNFQDEQGRTEACFIVDFGGIDGLKLFIENGGQFNPKAKTRSGYTEIMQITNICGMEGLKLFVENNGQFNPEATGSDGCSELIHIVTKCGISGLTLFIENGGQFNPNAISKDGETETYYIARYCGVEGLRLFAAHGGDMKISSRKGANDPAIKAITKAIEADMYTGIFNHMFKKGTLTDAIEGSLQSSFQSALATAVKSVEIDQSAIEQFLQQQTPSAEIDAQKQTRRNQP